MWNHKNFVKIVLSVGFLGGAIAPNASSQGSPDILWQRKVAVDRVNSVIFTPDGNRMISGGSDRLIRFWNVADGALLQTLNTNAPFVHESAVEWLSINRNATLLASCSYRLIQLWDLTSGTQRRLTGHTDWVVSVAFSPDGTRLASASFDGTVKIWNPSTGALVTSLPAPGQQRCVAFSPDGSLLAAAGADSIVRLYHTSDWSIAKLLVGHSNDIYTCVFSPDGHTLASGGYDQTVKLWNVSDGTLKNTFGDNGGNVYSIAFTPDGSQLAYTDGEGDTVKIYRTADGTLLRTFTEEVDDVQTLAFAPNGLLGYGRIDETVLLTRINDASSARITSPTGGSIIKSPANITITATPGKNDGSITKMEFFQNGISLGEDTTAPFSFDWNDVPAGNYALTVVDTDILGVTTTSSAIHITLADQTNLPPSVAISSPASGATFSAGATVNISANASADSGVAKVEFFVDGTSIGADTKAPFTLSWNSSMAGTYNLTAVVTDKIGATAEAASAVITITPAPVETVKPRVIIVSPRAGARVTFPTVQLSGTASDNVGLAEVLYSVNGDPFRAAVGTGSWQTAVTPSPGANVVQVKSVDVSGNESVIASLKFTYVVSSAIAVQVNGVGTVRSLRDGQVLEVGKIYSIAATPGRDQVFNGWTGTITTNKGAFSFRMESAMTLTANFVQNLFPPVKGTYLGLIQPLIPTHEGTGFFRITTASSGAFSGRITLGGKNYSVKGKFNGDGTCTISNAQTGRTLSLKLDLTNGSDEITGTLSDATSISSFVGNRQVFSKSNPASQIGRYTVLIVPDATKPSAPQGNGFGVLKVDASGNARLSGTLADGTPFSQSAAISKKGDLPFYFSAYRGAGSISGQLQFRDLAAISDLDGTVHWFRPTDSRAKIFGNGFTAQTELIGSRYVQAAGAPILNVPQGENNVLVNFGNGNLESELQQPITLESNNRFQIPATMSKVRIGVTASSGAMQGSFIHPGTGRTTTHRGVIFQKQNRAEGFFLGTAQAGFVSVVPADAESSEAKVPETNPTP